MNSDLAIGLAIVAALVVSVTVIQLLCKWRDNAVEHERQRSYERGQFAGRRSAMREYGIEDTVMRANLLSWARWAERGCPDCKASLFSSWFGLKRGVLLFEFRCGAMWSNEKGGTCTSKGIDCEHNIARNAERETERVAQ